MANNQNKESKQIQGAFGGKVGYKNPPKSGQFKPGQSGNPKGRKKKERDQICDIIEEIFFGEQTVNLNGQKKKISSLRITFMKLLQQSQNGDIRSTRLMFDLIEKHGYAEKKIGLIGPFVPSLHTLAEYHRDELDDDWYNL